MTTFIVFVEIVFWTWNNLIKTYTFWLNYLFISDGVGCQSFSKNRIFATRQKILTFIFLSSRTPHGWCLFVGVCIYLKIVFSPNYSKVKSIWRAVEDSTKYEKSIREGSAFTFFLAKHTNHAQSPYHLFFWGKEKCRAIK